MSELNWKLTDNSQLVMNAKDSQIKKALTICGQMAEGYAKLNLGDLIRKENSTTTGNLKNSITFQVNDRYVEIGTAVKYGIYFELGTGVHASAGNGRRTKWRYKDAHGKWHTTDGQVPRPYLVPAIKDHIQEYRQVIKDELSK